MRAPTLALALGVLLTGLACRTPPRTAAPDLGPALHVAAMMGDVRTLEKNLRAGADPNWASTFGRTPLHLAAEKGQLEAAKLLVRRGADPWRQDGIGDLPIDAAFQNSTGPVAGFLFDVMTATRPEALGSVLQAAVIWGNPDLAARELAAGGDVNKPDYRGMAPVQLAFSVLPMTGRRAKLILERRARLSPGEWAPAAGRLAVVRLLLANGAEPNVVNKGWTPLDQAAMCGSLEGLRLLVEHGARPAAGVLDQAAYAGRADILRYLLGKGFPPDGANSGPLHAAAGRADLESVTVLLDGGANPDRLDYGGRTPLDRAREWAGSRPDDAAAWEKFGRLSALLSRKKPGSPSDAQLSALVLAAFKKPPLSDAQRKRVGRFAALVHSRHRGALADFLVQHIKADAKKRVDAKFAADPAFKAEFYSGPVTALNAALGDRGYALPLEPLKAEAAPVLPAVAALKPLSPVAPLLDLELAKPVPYLESPAYRPAYGVFSSVRPSLWGKGKVLGAPWRHELPFESALRGLAVGRDGKGRYIELPRGAGAAVLRGLDGAGHLTSSAALRMDSRELASGMLGDERVLAALDGQTLRFSGLARPAAGAPAEPVSAFAFARFGHGGALVAVDGKENGTVTAYGAGGSVLWARAKLKMGYLSAPTAGRLRGKSSDSVLLLGGRGRRSFAWLLDERGKVEREYPVDTWLRLVRLADLEGDGARVVAVESRGSSEHDLLKIWDVSKDTWTLRHQADLGWAQVETVAFADFDRDGRKEIVLGSDNGWVLVYSSSAELLADYKFVTKISHLSPGDMTGDGADEVLVGVEGIPPQVFMLSVTDTPPPWNAPRKR